MYDENIRLRYLLNALNALHLAAKESDPADAARLRMLATEAGRLLKPRSVKPVVEVVS